MLFWGQTVLENDNLYAIAGLIGSDGGQVLLDGQDIHARQCIEERVWALDIYREMSVFRGLNVEDNILVILDIWNLYS